MFAFRVRHRVFHPKGWSVKDLGFVFVNSFIVRLATVFVRVYNVLGSISLIVCMTVSVNNDLRYFYLVLL